MKIRLLIGLLAAFIIFAAGFLYQSYAYIFFLQDQQLVQLTVKKHFFAKDETVILVEVAKTAETITDGLSNRQHLQSKNGQSIDGMLFVFPNKAKQNFWMKGMLFNLDICWLSNTIISSCQRNVFAPQVDQTAQTLQIYSSPLPANLVLETAPGFFTAEDLPAKLFFK